MSLDAQRAEGLWNESVAYLGLMRDRMRKLDAVVAAAQLIAAEADALGDWNDRPMRQAIEDLNARLASLYDWEENA